MTDVLACRHNGCRTTITARANPQTWSGTSLEALARVQGWAVWEGTTISGAESSAIYCPQHNGKAGDPLNDDPAEDGWDAECDTCMTNAATDDPDFDGTEQAADEWSDDHVCESITRTIPPKTSTVAA